MNRLAGRIRLIHSHQGVSLVECGTAAGALRAVVVDTPSTAPWIAEGGNLFLLFKETEVWPFPEASAPAGLSGISGILARCTEGEILTRLDFESPAGTISSLIDRGWARSLQLEAGAHIRLLVHPAAVALQEPGRSGLGI